MERAEIRKAELVTAYGTGIAIAGAAGVDWIRTVNIPADKANQSLYKEIVQSREVGVELTPMQQQNTYYNLEHQYFMEAHGTVRLGIDGVVAVIAIATPIILHAGVKNTVSFIKSMVRGSGNSQNNLQLTG